MRRADWRGKVHALTWSTWSTRTRTGSASLRSVHAELHVLGRGELGIFCNSQPRPLRAQAVILTLHPLLIEHGHWRTLTRASS
jgi:hypothetical protein